MEFLSEAFRMSHLMDKWIAVFVNQPMAWPRSAEYRNIGLIQIKGEGWTGFSEDWQGCSEGFHEGEAQGKS